MQDMVDRLKHYRRMQHDGIPIYVNPDMPDWFVPAERADRMLAVLLATESTAEAAVADSSMYGTGLAESLFLVERFIDRFSHISRQPYTGRKDVHSLQRLRECWFHITNSCTMRCTHCMFSSGPDETACLEREAAEAAVAEALRLGTELFYEKQNLNTPFCKRG